MESTSSPEIPLEVRKEITRLRSIMYETTVVRLSTAIRDGGRWLTDQYVCLDVTDSVAVEGLVDGQYKLTAGKGLVPLYYESDGLRRIRPSEFDADAYFDLLTKADWRRVAPTEWSVAEHPGKAMLFSVYDRAVFMGEETWATLRRTFQNDEHEVRAEYAMNLTLNVFRIIWGGATEPAGAVVAYVAGIRCPEGQEEIAAAIARLAESTSNQLEGA